MRRPSLAAIAPEVADVFTEKGYKVIVQDYDIPLGSSFVEKMHDAVSNSRNLVILFTHDYLRSPYTRKEFTSFEAQHCGAQRRGKVVVLRCEDAPLIGLDSVYQKPNQLWLLSACGNAPLWMRHQMLFGVVGMSMWLIP